MLKVIRIILGSTIAFFDWISRGRRKRRSPEAQQMIEQQLKNLSLYQFKLCPFCIKVRRKMHQLNLPIELRDAKADPRHREALQQGGGRIKVPCLRIESSQGTQWMYESDDINHYLEQQFG